VKLYWLRQQNIWFRFNITSTVDTTMATRRDVPGIRQYDHPAGGWGALRATAKAVKEQMGVG
jgi:hypothetical protein